jgi:hypothetical protein
VGMCVSAGSRDHFPRYSPRALPPYRFVPGETPRPSLPADPPARTRDGWKPAEWRGIEEWLWAVDLFNHGYWWESHEALEGLWHAAGRTTAQARFVQALIHLSAACLNRHRGHDAAARRQAARAVRGLHSARHAIAPLVMGIDVEALAADIERAFSGSDDTPVRFELHRTL